MTYDELPAWELHTMDRERCTLSLMELAAIFMADPAVPRWRYALVAATGFSSSAVSAGLDRMVNSGWLVTAAQDPAGPKPPNQRGTPRTYYLTTELGRAEMRELLRYLRHLANMARQTRAPYERMLP
jgi:hypothetical protein